MWLSDFYPDTRGKRGDMALRADSQRNLLTPGGTYGEPITEGLRAVYQALPDAVLDRLRMDKATELTLTFRIGTSTVSVYLEVPRDEIINTPVQVAHKLMLLG